MAGIGWTIYSNGFRPPGRPKSARTIPRGSTQHCNQTYPVQGGDHALGDATAHGSSGITRNCSENSAGANGADKSIPSHGSSSGKQHLFRRTLLNVGNTCFFNSVIQVIASPPAFLAEIEQTPLPPNHAHSSYCLAFLKLFIPAIVSPTSLPSSELDLFSVKNGDCRMTRADWIDFVHRLTAKYDKIY